MGIYLKGMEMPKEIDPSITIEFATGLSGKLYARYHDYNSGGSTEWHKVMTIPEPHGRLIDADKNTFPTPHRNPSNDYMKGWNACLHSVQQQPTVIPAEEET